MANLKDNIKQAISDFDEIEKAIEECGVDVPYGTDTKDYGDKIREIKGKAATKEWSNFWDSVQSNGTRTDYEYAFSYKSWTEKTFKPKYDINATKSARGLFSNSAIVGDLDAILNECGVKLNFGNQTNLTYVFSQLNGTTKVPCVNIPNNSSSTGMFRYSYDLKTASLNLLGETKFNITFDGCTSLENLTITGSITSDGLNVQWSPLTHDSLMSIINALSDNSSGTTKLAVTLGGSNVAKLSAEELQIAYDKGWTVS